MPKLRRLLWAGRRSWRCGVGIAVVALLATTPATAHATAGHTIVSLEFDDGWADATIAQSLLSANGIHATFFVNSGFLGRTNRLTLAQVQSIAADGNEIGGHTIDHPHLLTLSADDQKREICDDRSALLADGFAVSDFAYPYGEFDATTEQIVAQCGYDSAREVAGLGCNGCPFGESIPPVDPYRTRTAAGVTSTTTLATLESFVTNAEQSNGGWVQIVFHQVCDGCGQYGVEPDELSQFLAWLGPRAATDGTTTQTVNQVIGGSVNPPVAGPPLPMADANLIPNPGFETDSDNNGVPDCWSLTGYGTNTPTWTRTSDAHSGAAAEHLVISSWTSGDRKALTSFDQGTCAPAVMPGHSYQASEWFTSTAPVRFVAYLRNATGSWSFWAQSPYSPAAGTWTRAVWTPPPIPAGSTAISIGLALSAAGSASFDDADLRLNLIPNPGFETDADANGVPDCWSLAGFGTNTSAWARTTAAHSGGFAERLTISAWTSGDRKALTTFDQGACAPTATPGHAYTASEWFTSSAPVRFVAYTRDSSGQWTFWAKSGFSAASNGWVQASWTTPPIPVGATAISVGLALSTTGTASFDDAQLIGTG